jgi:hypothetical protein
MIVRFIAGFAVVMAALWAIGWLLSNLPLVLVVIVIAGGIGWRKRRADA